MNTVCAQCKEEMGDSPSDDFCSEKCQLAWLRKKWGNELSPRDFVAFVPRYGLPTVVGAPVLPAGPAGSAIEFVNAAEEAA